MDWLDTLSSSSTVQDALIIAAALTIIPYARWRRRQMLAENSADPTRASRPWHAGLRRMLIIISGIYVGGFVLVTLVSIGQDPPVSASVILMTGLVVLFSIVLTSAVLAGSMLVIRSGSGGKTGEGAEPPAQRGRRRD